MRLRKVNIRTAIVPPPAVLLFLLLIYLCIPGTSRAQESDTLRSSLEIAFPINSHTIDRGFGSNAAVLDSLERLIADTRGSSAQHELREIHLYGMASPDGRLTANLRLAKQRISATYGYINANYGVADSLIILHEATVPWQEFRDILAGLGDPRLLPIASKGSDDSWLDSGIRMDRLKALDGGAVWRRLAREVFPRLRRSAVINIILEKRPGRVSPEETAQEAEEEIEIEEEVILPTATETIPEPEPEPELTESSCRRSWHVSTSALGWALGMINVMGEYDFGCHWSVGLSVYYSGWNYARATRKFRTFLFRPEVRYWFDAGHRGFFVDAHVQMAAYNFALPGWDYRIQDAKGHHPALGGGIGAGYRLPLDRHGRWAAEAALGIGVYHLEYDRFVNEQNGAHVDRRERTFFGIDNVALSVVYNFNAFAR